MTRTASVFVSMLLGLAPACSSSYLRDLTVETSSTLTDLQYQLVLDNLAMMTANPDLLPWHAKLDGGSIQVSDEQRAEIGLSAAQVASTSEWLQGRAMLMPSRQRTQQWDIIPVTNPKELRDLQAAYQKALGYNTDQGLLQDLDVPSGWFGQGTLDDIPADAMYTGQYRNQAVWVTARGIRGLSKLTLIVLSIVEFKAGERSFIRGVISTPH